MASRGNQHCANCIGTLSFHILKIVMHRSPPKCFSALRPQRLSCHLANGLNIEKCGRAFRATVCVSVSAQREEEAFGVRSGRSQRLY